MWNRNSDTGKWTQQSDTLSKESYDSLKQDLEKVRLHLLSMPLDKPKECENCGCTDETVKETEAGVLCDECYDIIGLEQLDMLGDDRDDPSRDDPFGES